MVASVTVDEVSEFRTAVAGVEIDWIRKDRGWGPATMTRAGTEQVALSTGGIDFSALLLTDLPQDRVGFQLMTVAPDGTRWNGTAARSLEMRVYRPGTSVFGSIPAGARAVTLVADLDTIAQVAQDLGRGELEILGSTKPLPESPAYRHLRESLQRLGTRPELLDQRDELVRLTEAVARSLAPQRHSGWTRSGRGYDSREVVARCLAYVETTGRHQPPISDLCRAAYVSESRLRQAFVEVLEVPPTQFFQLRVLSLLREQLLHTEAEPRAVTTVESSLGLTQFGRVAARYREVFGETPSQTLRR